jgi:isopenicillin N synthase-like dioxygenase
MNISAASRSDVARPDEPKFTAHLGARAHTDTNAFTILPQDNNGGLEIRNRDNEWVAVRRSTARS